MADLQKVTAFILRSMEDSPSLVLFRHPHAGIQIPAGTVEAGETPEAAALREAGEESGLGGLTMIACLGNVTEPPVIGDHYIARATEVYSRPDTGSFNWARLRSGVTVRLLRAADGFAQVTFEEPDRWPDPHYATYQITGWVPQDALCRTAARYFYLFTHVGDTPASWTVPIDNHLFQPFWAPLHSLPEIISPQAPWLAFLFRYLAGKP